VGMSAVVPLLHVLRDLVVRLRNDLFDWNLLESVSKAAKRIVFGHQRTSRFNICSASAASSERTSSSMKLSTRPRPPESPVLIMDSIPAASNVVLARSISKLFVKVRRTTSSLSDWAGNSERVGKR